jgi:signal transduction histidine kinase
MTQRLADAHEEICRERHSRTLLLEQLRHSDRLSTIGRIASSIAHELGTPLNVVSGRASMIASGDLSGPEAQESARIISDQADRMAAIIRQLLGFARAEGVLREHTDVCAIVHRAKNLMEPLAERSEVAIVLDNRGPVEAAVDEGKVLQVLTNLMMNGIEAMPRGGRLSVSVDARMVARPPDHRAAPGEYVRICVRDQGSGIDPDNIELIFEPFFTTRPGCNGTGLGLPVCQGILEEHGGWLEVETHSGQGSCFAVNLPVKQEEAKLERQTG